jgi:hypothetical protein
MAATPRRATRRGLWAALRPQQAATRAIVLWLCGCAAARVAAQQQGSPAATVAGLPLSELLGRLAGQGVAQDAIDACLDAADPRAAALALLGVGPADAPLRAGLHGRG